MSNRPFNEYEVGEALRSGVPEPAQGYWADIDARLQAAGGRENDGSADGERLDGRRRIESRREPVNMDPVNIYMGDMDMGDMDMGDEVPQIDVAPGSVDSGQEPLRYWPMAAAAALALVVGVVAVGMVREPRSSTPVAADRESVTVGVADQTGAANDTESTPGRAPVANETAMIQFGDDSSRPLISPQLLGTFDCAGNGGTGFWWPAPVMIGMSSDLGGGFPLELVVPADPGISPFPGVADDGSLQLPDGSVTSDEVTCNGDAIQLQIHEWSDLDSFVRGEPPVVYFDNLVQVVNDSSLRGTGPSSGPVLVAAMLPLDAELPLSLEARAQIGDQSVSSTVIRTMPIDDMVLEPQQSQVFIEGPVVLRADSFANEIDSDG